MTSRNYNEYDLTFYHKEKIDSDVQLMSQGFEISWEPVPDISGYAIYRSERADSEGELIMIADAYMTRYLDAVPLTNLYFYTVYAIIEGDLLVNENGDFQLTNEYESARQDITNRIRTIKTDWRSHPEIGADLEDLIGEPNTRQTGEVGVQKIYETLTFDDRFSGEDLTIRAVPTSIETIDFYVILDTQEDIEEPVIVKESLHL